MTWRTLRRRGERRLQRDDRGLARIAGPGAQVSAVMRYSEAIALFSAGPRDKRATTAECTPSSKRALFVHGMLGEQAEFPDLAEAMARDGWDLDYVRYDTAARSFGRPIGQIAQHMAKSTDQQGGQGSVSGKRARQAFALVGHSFGCRLIAAAAAQMASHRTLADTQACLATQPTSSVDRADAAKGDAARGLSNVGAQSQSRIKAVFIAPAVDSVRWAQRGAAIAPVRAFLGGALKQMAARPMDQSGLGLLDLLVVEGVSGSYRSEGDNSESMGDGWLRAQETHIAAAHQRLHINAGHSDLPGDAACIDAISRFLNSRA